jgi:hypothetical protein
VSCPNKNIKANESNPKNEHLQQVINSFILVYKDDEKQCKERQSLMSSTNSSMLSGLEERTHSLASSFLATRKNSSDTFERGGSSRNLRDIDFNDINKSSSNLTVGKGKHHTPSISARSRERQLAMSWHPFHPDIQKTVHFW